jgi:hypothetical protein
MRALCPAAYGHDGRDHTVAGAVHGAIFLLSLAGGGRRHVGATRAHKGMAVSYDVNCAACQAVVGACMDCGGCFMKHCLCDPCQHGKSRAEIDQCAACRPGLASARVDEALVGEDRRLEDAAHIDEILDRGSDLQPGEGDRDEPE